MIDKLLSWLDKLFDQTVVIRKTIEITESKKTGPVRNFRVVSADYE